MPNKLGKAASAKQYHIFSFITTFCHSKEWQIDENVLLLAVLVDLLFLKQRYEVTGKYEL